MKAVSYDETTMIWSDPIVVANHATIAKAIVDDGKFYIVWAYVDPEANEWGKYIGLSTSTDGIHWTDPTAIAQWEGATNWDPVLIKEKGVFKLFWAPDVGLEGQVIATSTSANPTDTTSWSLPVQLTTANYDGNSWWDFWPCPYNQGSTYLFYTSERNSPGNARIDGNIWMMQIIK